MRTQLTKSHMQFTSLRIYFANFQVQFTKLHEQTTKEWIHNLILHDIIWPGAQRCTKVYEFFLIL